MINMLQRLLFVKKKITIALPIAMIIGFVMGYFYNTSFLSPLIMPLTILMVYPMMVTLNIKSVLLKCSLKVQIATQLINFLVIPFIGFFIGYVFLSDNPSLWFGLLLISLLPTSAMSISWTGLAKGNVNVAVKMTIIGLIAGTLIAPFYAVILMGQVIDIPIFRMFQQIATFIFVPLILAHFTRLVLIKKFGTVKFEKEIKPDFPVISTIAMLITVGIAISMRSTLIAENPVMILGIFPALFIFYGANYLVSSVIGRKFFDLHDAVALVYGTVLRSLSISLAIAITVFGNAGTEMALIISLAYIIQSQSAAWFMKLRRKVLKERGIIEKIKHLSES